MIYSQSYINFLLAVKFNYVSIRNVSRFNFLNVAVSYVSRIKLKYLIFFIIILSLIVISSLIKVGKVRDRPLTTLFFLCRSQKATIIFLKNFIYLYLPTLDSFVSKITLKKLGYSSVNFSMSKFPLIIEADLLLSHIDELLAVYNLIHINFILTFSTSPFKLDSIAFCHFNKLPIVL